MATKQPPGLGDLKLSDFVLTKETRPVPLNRQALIEQFVEILSLGSVQKVVVEVKKPIEFWRLVPRGEDVSEELQEDELYQSAVNSPIQDLKAVNNDNIEPLAALFHCFAFLSSKRLKPRALLVKTLSDLAKWLEVDEMFPLDEVFGIEVIVDARMPDETALLVGITPGAQDHVELSLRILMSL